MTSENSDFSLRLYEAGNVPTGTVVGMYLLKAKEYIVERVGFSASSDSGTVNINSSPDDSVSLYTTDPEILALTRGELIAKISELGGKWAGREDINDDWLNDLRSNWDERLKRNYGSSSSSTDPHL
jgi:hypothetical protein